MNATDLDRPTERLHARIAELEAEVTRLRVENLQLFGKCERQKRRAAEVTRLRVENLQLEQANAALAESNGRNAAALAALGGGQ